MTKTKTGDLKLGVALGGGSALGFAHLGVLKALEENEIKIDSISGTSVGAIFAALYAFGVSFADIETEAANLNWLKLAQLRPSRLGLTSNVGIKAILNRYIGKADIKDAEIPLAIMTTDLETGSKVVFKSGDVVDAVLASSCMPGLFIPVKMNGLMLVDGGIVENVPISPLKSLGAEVTVGVNLMRYRKYTKPKNIMGVLANSFDMINHRISAQPRKDDVNFLIEPNLSDYLLSDIKNWKEISDIGYKEAQKYILAIKDAKHQTPGEEIWDKFKELFADA